MIRSKVKQVVSTFVYIYIKMCVCLSSFSPQLCFFFCTRARYSFPLGVLLFLLCRSKVDTNNIQKNRIEQWKKLTQSKTRKQNKPIAFESHTLCLNDLFSFCHFSLVLCACVELNKCIPSSPKFSWFKLNGWKRLIAHLSFFLSFLLWLVNVFFCLYLHTISTVYFCCTFNNAKYK